MLRIAANGYSLRFTSPPLLLQTPWEILFPKGSQKIQGMREQISLILQKNAISLISSDNPGFCFERIPGTQGVWRVASSYRPEKLNHHIDAPHFCMHTISSVPSTIERGDYTFKIDLQDANYHVLIHPDSRKYPRFAFENKVYQF